MNEEHLRAVILEVVAELRDATDKFGEFSSAHHGYAVILEELDELWDCIKSKESTSTETRAEALQVAAMAIRFILDVLYPNGATRA